MRLKDLIKSHGFSPDLAEEEDVDELDASCDWW